MKRTIYPSYLPTVVLARTWDKAREVCEAYTKLRAEKAKGVPNTDAFPAITMQATDPCLLSACWGGGTVIGAASDIALMFHKCNAELGAASLRAALGDIKAGAVIFMDDFSSWKAITGEAPAEPKAVPIIGLDAF